MIRLKILSFKETTSFPNYILYSIVLGIFALLTVDLLLGLIVTAIVILFFIGYGKKFLISIIIILLLTFSSDIDVSIRLIIQIFSFAGLLYLFLDKYGLKTSSYPKIPNLLRGFLILFYFTMLVSIVFSTHPIIGIFLLFRVTVFYLVVYIFYSYLSSFDDIDLLIKGLVISCIILSIGIFYQLFSTGFNLFDFANNTQLRFAGFNSNVNASAGVFAAVLPIAISLFFYKKNQNYKYTLGFIILFIILALFLTSSRAAIVSVLISLFVILYFLRRKIFIKSLIIILSIILIVYFIEPLAELFSILIRLDSGISFREMYWKLSTNIIKDNFLVGIGPGNYQYVMYDYYPIMMNSGVSWFMTNLQEMVPINNNSHNFYLMFFSDMGILGLVSSVVLPIVFFNISRKIFKQLSISDGRIYFIVLGIIAAGIGLFIRGMFETIGLIFYGYITTDLPFWILFSILIFFYFNLKKINKSP